MVLPQASFHEAAPSPVSKPHDGRGLSPEEFQARAVYFCVWPFLGDSPETVIISQ